MKWLPRNGLKNRNVAAHKKPCSNFLSLSQLLLLTTCLILAGVFLPGNISRLKSKIFVVESDLKSSAEIDEIAASISVKISSEGFLGSGFMALEERGKYTVITNQHVLRAGEAPYSIQTPDGKVHVAEVVPISQTAIDNYDLAVLEFMAREIYTTAKIGSSFNLEVGEPIYAAGFPYTEQKIPERVPDIFEQPEVEEIDGFELKLGRIAIILNKALEEGYQIGYTNDVRKGMSGGPLLNHQGEVVGINGKHAYPLWESTELYQDGTQPCPALQELITRSSLAIPIEKTTKLTPKLKSLKQPTDIKANKQLDWSAEESDLAAKMQAEAEATNKSCQKQETKSSQ